MNDMLVIDNQGPLIGATNYFDTLAAKKGLFYLSWNAGAARLLVPDSQERTLSEMRTGHYVIISRGPWLARSGQGGIELLFEDHTETPYSLHLSVEQTDRLLPAGDEGSEFTVSIWTRRGMQAQMPGKYRRVASIPCLEPWIERQSPLDVRKTSGERP